MVGGDFMNNDIEKLLYEEEGSTLDFKREQYPLDSTDENQKSELLKDILAFANAWRRSDAYILVGVEEVKGGKSIVHGITYDLDDAKLQQFVNSKTQRPVTFEYKSTPLEGKYVGVITVPLQTRPIYLKKDYGKLKANVVYLRRGSSTAEADPDEIAKMGSASPELYKTQPNLQIEFAKNKGRIRLGRELEADLIKLLVPQRNKIPNYEESRSNAFMPMLGYTNKEFYRELVDYYYWKNICTTFTFYIENISNTSALGIKAEISIPKIDAFGVLEESQIPDEPYSTLDFPHVNYKAISHNIIQKSDSLISETTDRWLIEIEVPRLQPKNSYFTQEKIYVYAKKDISIDFDVALYSDNLTMPIKSKLMLRLKVLDKPEDLETIKKMHYQLMLQRCENKLK